MKIITIDQRAGPITIEPGENRNRLRIKGAEAAVDEFIDSYAGLRDGTERSNDPETWDVDKEAVAQVVQHIVYEIANKPADPDWLCDDCSALNDPADSVCHQCDADRP